MKKIFLILLLSPVLSFAQKVPLGDSAVIGKPPYYIHLSTNNDTVTVYVDTAKGYGYDFRQGYITILLNGFYVIKQVYLNQRILLVNY